MAWLKNAKLRLSCTEDFPFLGMSFRHFASLTSILWVSLIRKLSAIHRIEERPFDLFISKLCWFVFFFTVSSHWIGIILLQLSYCFGNILHGLYILYVFIRYDSLVLFAIFYSSSLYELPSESTHVWKVQKCTNEFFNVLLSFPNQLKLITWSPSDDPRSHDWP